MPIRCGHCKESHNSVAEVRSCATSQGVLVQAGKRMVQEAISGTTDYNPPTIRDITEGLWYLGKRIIKVQIAHHGSKRPYTKELVQTSGVDRDDPAWRFEMLKGGITLLRRSQDVRKMTLEEAAEFGKLYGICCSCGTILTNEDSIARGIGPICAGKF